MRPSWALLPALVAAGQWAPALTSIPQLRRTLTPALAGASASPHIALTYDDGPDPDSTPHFLRLLEQQGRTATFFLLGEHVERNRGLVRHMAESGHELAVHGWDHHCLAAKPPGTLAGELRRTTQLLEDVTGKPVTWYRPPYGVLTGEGLMAARVAGLRTVLWTAWGKDWTSKATPDSIVRTVRRALRPGGTVLLHDTDRTCAPGSWRNTLGASHILLQEWRHQDLRLGPLREHWSSRRGCAGSDGWQAPEPAATAGR